ncbi:hypothetical protein GCM10008931_31510 [Oceanobacillus oncorhynchi subsp. oncorhynchi]
MKVGWGWKITIFMILLIVILIMLFPNIFDLIPYIQPGLDFGN